jgi:hypothetical protein
VIGTPFPSSEWGSWGVNGNLKCNKFINWPKRNNNFSKNVKKREKKNPLEV